MRQSYMFGRQANGQRSLRQRLATAAMLSVVTLGFSGVATMGPASAARGTTTNGCYAEWFNTAFSGSCYNTKGSNKRLSADCTAQIDYRGAWKYVSGTKAPFDSSECTTGVRSAYLSFS